LRQHAPLATPGASSFTGGAPPPPASGACLSSARMPQRLVSAAGRYVVEQDIEVERKPSASCAPFGAASCSRPALQAPRCCDRRYLSAWDGRPAEDRAPLSTSKAQRLSVLAAQGRQGSSRHSTLATLRSKHLWQTSDTRIRCAFITVSWQLVQRAGQAATPAAAARYCDHRRTAGTLRCNCLPPRSNAPRRVGADALHRCAHVSSKCDTLRARCLSISLLYLFCLLDGA